MFGPKTVAEVDAAVNIYAVGDKRIFRGIPKYAPQAIEFLLLFSLSVSREQRMTLGKAAASPKSNRLQMLL
jgi:hypothetical protein